jgi:hypothetical protein
LDACRIDSKFSWNQWELEILPFMSTSIESRVDWQDEA